MKVLTVIGNRPQFVKAAAVSRRAAGGRGRDPHPHRTALRRRDELRLLHGARRPATDARARARDRQQHRADGSHAQRARPGDRRRPTGRRARLRRHELHARGWTRGGAGGGPRRARRSRHAVVRSHDAGGAQPGPHRPPVVVAARVVGRAGAAPGARARGRDGRDRGRRDGRRGIAGPAARAGERLRAAGRRGRRRGVRAGDRAPRGERGRPEATTTARRPAPGAAVPASCCRCTRERVRDSTRRDGWTNC